MEYKVPEDMFLEGKRGESALEGRCGMDGGMV
jgi:hypothetical protein